MKASVNMLQVGDQESVIHFSAVMLSNVYWVAQATTTTSTVSASMAGLCFWFCFLGSEKCNSQSGSVLQVECLCQTKTLRVFCSNLSTQLR